MAKKNRKELNRIHRNPLPVELSVDTRGELPLVNVTNGASWLWLWIRMACMYLSSPPRAPKIRIGLEEPGVFAVRDVGDMQRCWNDGFFGKGTLSRLEPTFRARVLGQERSSEAVTSERRGKRREFKELRAQHQRFETEERKRELNEEEKAQWEELKVKMAEANTESKVVGDKLSPVVLEDELEELEKLEFLQLDVVEAFFLVYALEVAEVRVDPELEPLGDLELMKRMAFLGAPEATDDEFISILRALLQKYVVYHHYRSLGWCVRDGIKFGCEYLLYKRGPPFHHAEFGILVTAADERRSWEETMAVARVVGGVKKTLVFAYVEQPSIEQLGEIWETKEHPRVKLIRLLQLFKVCEMVYRRWSPSRTRE